MTKARLANLEKAVRDRGNRGCPLCHGDPWAGIYKVVEPDPDAVGYRATGERYFMDDDGAKIGDDFCCRRCGTPVADNRLVELMMIKGVSWPPREGRVGRALPPAPNVATRT